MSIFISVGKLVNRFVFRLFSFVSSLSVKKSFLKSQELLLHGLQPSVDMVDIHFQFSGLFSYFIRCWFIVDLTFKQGILRNLIIYNLFQQETDFNHFNTANSFVLCLFCTKLLRVRSY